MPVNGTLEGNSSLASSALGGATVSVHADETVGRFNPAFSNVMSELQLLLQQGRPVDAVAVLQCAFGMGGRCTSPAQCEGPNGCVCRVPALVAAVWTLALVDGGDTSTARSWVEQWLHVGASKTQMAGMSEESGRRAIIASDHASLLHVYIIEVLVRATCEDLAARVISNDEIASDAAKERLFAALASAVRARDAASAARIKRAERAASAIVPTTTNIAHAATERIDDGVCAVDGTTSMVSGNTQSSGSESDSALVNTDAGLASLLRRMNNLVSWLTTLLAVGPGRKLDPTRVAAAVAAAVLVLGIVRRVASTVVGAGTLSVVARELAWAVEKAFAGLV